LRLADQAMAQDPPWCPSMGLRVLQSLPVVFE
jgi:hypothetical protein